MSTKVATANRTEGTAAESAESAEPGERAEDTAEPEAGPIAEPAKSAENGGDTRREDTAESTAEDDAKGGKGTEDAKGGAAPKDATGPNAPKDTKDPKDTNAPKDAKTSPSSPSWAKPATGASGTPKAREAASGDSGDSGKGASKGGDGSQGADGGKPGADTPDQATAVFRALPRPAVDQPTTALKIPSNLGAGKGGKGGKSADGRSTDGNTSDSRPSDSESEDSKSEDSKAGAGKTGNGRTGGAKTGGVRFGKSAETGGAGTGTGPGTGKAGSGKAETGGAGKAEDPAERTSTFVPLRRDGGQDAAAKPAPSGPVSPVPTPPSEAGPIPEAERTRQQPMPPMPPLDLLAELTNTPETPVRTAVRRIKIWTPLVLLVLVVIGVVQAVRPLPAPELVLSAASSHTFDGDELSLPWPGEGQGAAVVDGVGPIGTYGAQKPAPIASVAKTMTAYVILKEHPIKGEQTGPAIEVDKKAGEEADRPDESTAPIKEGQKYTEKQMLQLLMIPSGNNAARLLARWDAGSEKAFVEKMNAAAEELGMENTTYTDPSGLDSATVSTPVDQIKLARAVMRNDIFRDIVNMPQADIPGIDKTIYNNNTILLEPGVGGIKTGSSSPAGGNLLWSANTVIDGKTHRVLGIVMGIQKADTLDGKLTLAKQESLKVIQAAQAGIHSSTVVKKGDVVGYVDDGLGTHSAVVATKDLKAVGWGGLKVTVALDEGRESVPHSAEAGTVVGKVSAGGVSVPVALQSALAEPGLGAKLTRLG
ncbi:serine hydrolase [Streptomyces sp. NPDC088258]|uniref:serine hydrolase n=1 Tax=Streptomyces sp. NPDC088258 TaxID=3365849 RepID=UPI00380AB014